ncbi:MAG: hypothetical protein JW934_22810 [Anaerolineae bacterium]|nr:hypothetical protein [Anaerolineae bacterium]
MVKKNGSLAGKGVEILYGKKSDEEETLVGESAEAGSVVEIQEGEPVLLDEAVEPLDPAWVANLEAEAAAVEVQPGSENLSGVGAPTADQGRPDWPLPNLQDEDRPAAPEPEEAMMALATTPVVEPLAGAMPVEQPLPDLATTPAGAGGVAAATPAQPAAAQPYIRPQPVQPAIDQPYTQPAVGYTSPVSSYTPPVQPVTAEPATAPLPTPRDKVEAWVSTPQAKTVQPLYVTAPRVTAEQLEQEVGVGMGELLPDKLQDADADQQPSRIREEAEVIEAIPPKERIELWHEINTLYERVAQELATHKDQKPALTLLREAQDILMEKPRQFDEAKYKVNQVKTLLQRRNAVITSTRTNAWWVFGYDILWIIVLFLLVFFVNPKFAKTGIEALWNTLLWGGIGGVVGGFYGLYRHASELQDFDKQYTMWYVAQPIIGLLLGGAIHLIMNAGFLAVNVEGTEVTMQWLPALLAFLGGFRQRFVLDLIANVVDRLSPPRESSSPGKKDEEAG